MAKELKRAYTLSDAELAMYTSNLVVFMTRDAVELAAKGVTAADTSALEALGNAFEVLPNDEYYRADIAIAVDTKNAARKALELKLREIIGCAKLKWGGISPQVNRFHARTMTKDSDKTFLITVRQAVVVAADYLFILVDQGLTQAMIDALAAQGQDMEDAMNAIAEAEAIRDLKTFERIEKGNELYDYVVKYCETGKIIWQDVNEAKYNDYIIYPTVHHGLAKPQNPVAIVDAGNPSHALVSCDPVPEATSYKLYYSEVTIGSPSGDFSYATVFPTPSFDFPMTVGKRTYWKIRAFSSETSSDYSNEVWLDA